MLSEVCASIHTNGSFWSGHDLKHRHEPMHDVEYLAVPGHCCAACVIFLHSSR